MNLMKSFWRNYCCHLRKSPFWLLGWKRSCFRHVISERSLLVRFVPWPISLHENNSINKVYIIQFQPINWWVCSMLFFIKIVTFLHNFWIIWNLINYLISTFFVNWFIKYSFNGSSLYVSALPLTHNFHNE